MSTSHLPRFIALTFERHSPTTQSEFDAYQNSVKAYAQSCIDLSTPPGIIGHLGTTETVEDWEIIRKALGYDKVNLYGVS